MPQLFGAGISTFVIATEPFFLRLAVARLIGVPLTSVKEGVLCT